MPEHEQPRVAFPRAPCHGVRVLERLFQLAARGTAAGFWVTQ
ncbi:MAG TPA: hypothetical protein VEP66_03170 [Myxococcales bacterium]|nr:hypothetical protein [Myxococcales bacterium]